MADFNCPPSTISALWSPSNSLIYANISFCLEYLEKFRFPEPAYFVAGESKTKWTNKLQNAADYK